MTSPSPPLPRIHQGTTLAPVLPGARSVVIDAVTHDLTTRALVTAVLRRTPAEAMTSGLWRDDDGLVRAARRAVADGATILEVGGLTRLPGDPGRPAHDTAGVAEAVISLSGLGVDVAIRATSAMVAETAALAGAVVVDDPSGGSDADLPSVVAEHEMTVILGPVHVNGSVRFGVDAFLDVGVPRERILLDPTAGTTASEGVRATSLAGIGALASGRQALQVSVSHRPLPWSMAVGRRHDRAAALGAELFALHQGARVVRTHDVRGTVRAALTLEAVLSTAFGRDAS